MKSANIRPDKHPIHTAKGRLVGHICREVGTAIYPFSNLEDAQVAAIEHNGTLGNIVIQGKGNVSTVTVSLKRG